MSGYDVDAYAAFGRAEGHQDEPLYCLLCQTETDGDITDDETSKAVCADCAGM